MDYRFLVIGGGVQGTHLSLSLLNQGGVERSALGVLDSHAAPLALWNRSTGNCRMSWLRSSVVQNIDLPALSIRRFAAAQPDLRESFYGRYNRPGLELFQRHARQVIESNHLAELRIHGRARSIVRHLNSLHVETEHGTISTGNVVLALGNTENLCEPEWATRLREQGARINHVFSADFEPATLGEAQRFVIIGGASSAIQFALYLAPRFPGMVTVLSEHEIKVAEFDYDAPWHGPRGRRQLDAEPDPVRRRNMIDAAKFSCTIPGDLDSDLSAARATGQLDLIVGRIEPLALRADGALEFLVHGQAGSQTQVCADYTILATGLRQGCPQPELIAALSEQHGLPLAPCGFPLPAPDLSWGKGIYVMGAHAELEIGPISRNIGGARRAAERISAAARLAV